MDEFALELNGRIETGEYCVFKVHTLTLRNYIYEPSDDGVLGKLILFLFNTFSALLQRINPGVAVAAKTRQASRSVLNKVMETLERLTEDGLIDEGEAERLSKVIKQFSMWFGFFSFSKTLLIAPFAIGPFAP